VGLRSLGLTDLGGGLCKRNSVLNVALAENYPNHTTTGDRSANGRSHVQRWRHNAMHASSL